MKSLGPPLFALAVVLVGSMTAYEPRDLVIRWQDGIERIPATNQQTCNAAVAAVAHGFWTPNTSRAMISIGCEPAAGEGPK